jgi:hypothetical protein
MLQRVHDDPGLLEEGGEPAAGLVAGQGRDQVDVEAPGGAQHRGQAGTPGALGDVIDVDDRHGCVRGQPFRVPKDVPVEEHVPHDDDLP